MGRARSSRVRRTRRELFLSNHLVALLAAILVVSLAGSAAAQGPLGPPDASGPGPTDYTGYAVLYLINGVRRDSADNQETEVVCTNVGKETASWAVQVFDADSWRNRPPICESSTFGALLVGQIGKFTTDSVGDLLTLSGTCPDGDTPTTNGLGRVIAYPKSVVLVCTARVIYAATRNVIADLPVTPLGKPPKIKIK